MRIKLNSDGIPNRISVMNSEGGEVMRIRNPSQDTIDLAECIRDMAVSRCRDLRDGINIDHIDTVNTSKYEGSDCALLELMHIFGIEESEL